MAYWSIQLRDGQPEKDPSDIKKLILGKSSSGWSTSNLRSTPVQPAISDASEKKKDESSSSFITTPLRGEVKKTPTIDPPFKADNSFTSAPLSEGSKEVHHLKQDKPVPTQANPVRPQQDPIEAYLDRFLSLSEMKKLSTPELIWISQFIEGESREQQIHLLRELHQMEGSLPSI